MKTKFRIEAREEGRGRPSVTRFADLVQAEAFIKARWQGAEYVDGPDAFHTDYCSYVLRGFTLGDVGAFSFDGLDRVFTFKSSAKPKPVCAKTCQDDSCDGSHCAACGGHFIDFYQTAHKICRECATERATQEAEENWQADRCANAQGCDSNGYDLRAPFPHASDPHWSSPEADFARW